MALSPKDPSERIVITFDFSNVTSDISSPTVVVTERNKTVPIPAMLSGPPQINGKKVLQLLTGGKTGKQYKVKCNVNVQESGEILAAADSILVKYY